jgi:threonine dehydratase
MLTVTEVLEARERIAAHVRVTPVVRLSERFWLKLEQLQHSGSFKARGACNRLFAAADAELRAGAVTASGGNHGLGLAYAAARRGVPATIFLPERAPQSSERRLRAMGAEVVRGGADWDDAWKRAAASAERSGALLVHPFEDREVIAGQGTVGLELDEQLAEVDAVVVAIGGGGLIGGVALALKARRPSVRVIGVEPTGATSMLQSLAAGRVVELNAVDTIAGTLAPRAIGPRTLALSQRYVDEVVLVSDAQMCAAMKQLWDELRILVEPAGAAAFAAAANGLVAGERIAVLICGANLDVELAVATLA